MRAERIVALCLLWAAAVPGAVAQLRHDLRSGWEIQSSCKLSGKTGAEISSARFQPKGWIKTSVPSTVLAAQLANKLVPDPMYGMNLRSIAGADYPIGKNFSNLPMPENSPYRCSWWYRTELAVPASFHGKHIELHFDGINYRANIWLNGKQVANSDDLVGTWRLFEFDITEQIHREDGSKGGQQNVLAVEVFPPTENDLALTWVDWAPAPPDKDMGLWRPVYLTTSGPVTIRNPHVKTELEPDLSVAHLTVEAEVTNETSETLNGEIGFVIRPPSAENLSQSKAADQETHRGPSPSPGLQLVTLAPHETRSVTFGAGQYPELNIRDPKVWWPAEMGSQPLYQMRLGFIPEMTSSDLALRGAESESFGIRQVTSELINGQRLFRINGRPLLIRGGGWAPDLLLREDHERLEDQFRMTRDMGLNTIRLEGKLESDYFYDLADKYGILVMPGWCCCDMWEKWDNWTDETYKVATASLADQIRRLRQHPSVFVWLNGSDNPPPANVEQMYLDVLKKYDWPNPVVSSATSRVTEVSGPSGVKMNGPYDYVPPNYWLDDTQRGGAFGFATEISPGPAIPTVESIARFVPRQHAWPAKDDEVWKYHSGGGQFANINIFSSALDQRYGPSTSLADFERKSQAAAYEGERAMFEGYTRNKYTFAEANRRAYAEAHGEAPAETPAAAADAAAAQPLQPSAKPWPATGVIQWMQNNAWPSVIWHLYDYFLVPGGGYYGTKEATKPLHVQYSYDDHSVVVISGPKITPQQVSVIAEAYNLDMTRTKLAEGAMQVTPDAVTPVTLTSYAGSQRSESSAALPAFDTPELHLSKTFFLRLQLKDVSGKLLDENVYWLSTQPDTLDQQHGTWYYTPESQYADLTGLSSLPTVKLIASSTIEHRGKEEIARVRLRNPSKNLAFMIHLRVARDNEDIAPVFWDDNYVSIFPGEERAIGGSFESRDGAKSEPVIHIDGWNVAPEALAAQASSRPAAAH